MTPGFQVLPIIIASSILAVIAIFAIALIVSGRRLVRRAAASAEVAPGPESQEQAPTPITMVLTGPIVAHPTPESASTDPNLASAIEHVEATRVDSRPGEQAPGGDAAPGAGAPTPESAAQPAPAAPAPTFPAPTFPAPAFPQAAAPTAPGAQTPPAGAAHVAPSPAPPFVEPAPVSESAVTSAHTTPHAEPIVGPRLIASVQTVGDDHALAAATLRHALEERGFRGTDPQDPNLLRRSDGTACWLMVTTSHRGQSDLHLHTTASDTAEIVDTIVNALAQLALSDRVSIDATDVVLHDDRRAHLRFTTSRRPRPVAQTPSPASNQDLFPEPQRAAPPFDPARR